MCNTEDNHTHQAHPTPHNQPTINSNGSGPISGRSATDFDAGYDRSRRGL